MMGMNEREALRTSVTVGKDGHIDVPRVDLPEGTEAELVIVVRVDGPRGPQHSLLAMRGKGKGTFGTPGEADAYLRSERDSWD